MKDNKETLPHLAIQADGERKRVAIYARCAQADSERLAEQLAELQTEAARHDYEVVAVAHDNGRPGARDNPGLCLVLDAVQAAGVESVLVTHVDRLSRDATEFTHILDALGKHGANVTTPHGVYKPMEPVPVEVLEQIEKARRRYRRAKRS